VVQEVEAALNDCRAAMSSEADDLKEKVETLRSASMKIGQYMYNQAQQNQGAEQQQANEGQEEEKKEEKDKQ